MSYMLAASLATLRQRAAILAAIRAFFAARGVLDGVLQLLDGSFELAGQFRQLVQRTGVGSPAAAFHRSSGLSQLALISVRGG